MHLLQRISSVLASESFTMMHCGSNGRKGSNLSVFIVVFSVFLFAMFMYNKDVKSIPEFPLLSKSTKAHQILTTATTTPGPTTITSLQSSDDGDMPKKEKKTKEADEQEGIKLPELEVARPKKVVVKVSESRDLFEGAWVLDNTTHPLYKKHEYVLMLSLKCLYWFVYVEVGREEKRLVSDSHELVLDGGFVVPEINSFGHTFSDPDIDEPQIEHLLQTAEAIRKDYPDEDWLHLTGLIHDLGKVLLHPKFGQLPQWAVVGDTFPVGCAFDKSNVHPQVFRGKPVSAIPNTTVNLEFILKDVDLTMC
ncbi:hypothetical protein J5N97_012922 [Dioscorea zingiberensis]|uniref:Inositol oxygenase n=1 Tax=Dioscorea zingiberensis TaxID=325984 RepID=A0A9D5HIA8_9LILI|nr:hypothetical protein J5N97_012922 [Dioscorea zingiberensis]